MFYILQMKIKNNIGFFLLFVILIITFVFVQYQSIQNESIFYDEMFHFRSGWHAIQEKNFRVDYVTPVFYKTLLAIPAILGALFYDIKDTNEEEAV